MAEVGIHDDNMGMGSNPRSGDDCTGQTSLPLAANKADLEVPRIGFQCDCRVASVEPSSTKIISGSSPNGRVASAICWRRGSMLSRFVQCRNNNGKLFHLVTCSVFHLLCTGISWPHIDMITGEDEGTVKQEIFSFGLIHGVQLRQAL